MTRLGHGTYALANTAPSAPASADPTGVKGCRMGADMVSLFQLASMPWICTKVWIVMAVEVD
jgi:hypothetical protein